jgi:hypothetical protein
MTKTIVYILTVVAVFSLTCCRKEYTCVCIGTENGEKIIETATVKAPRQSKALIECAALDYTNEAAVAFTCEI